MSDAIANSKVIRCFYDVKEFVNATVERDLLEARSLGHANVDDDTLKHVLGLVDQALTAAVDRTVTRVQSLQNPSKD